VPTRRRVIPEQSPAPTSPHHWRAWRGGERKIDRFHLIRGPAGSDDLEGTWSGELAGMISFVLKTGKPGRVGGDKLPRRCKEIVRGRWPSRPWAGSGRSSALAGGSMPVLHDRMVRTSGCLPSWRRTAGPGKARWGVVASVHKVRAGWAFSIRPRGPWDVLGLDVG